ncbi:hypothetical protein [Streptomyces sp. NPDC090798]|uniref:hypothetical protein n=1 Tax=Streptomyces sp. NPDC090798 TaxID=3365968 RepID=UPI0037F19258
MTQVTQVAEVTEVTGDPGGSLTGGVRRPGRRRGTGVLAVGPAAETPLFSAAESG